MKFVKATLVAALALTVSGCASVDVATRNASFEAPKEQSPLSEVIAIRDVEVNVSRDLRVSEAELFYPVADIVWRGEARGDRYEQVGAIFQDSAKVATKDLRGATPAHVEIDVLRFHSVTDKARYTVGGSHSISFMMRVTDPATGIDLMAPRKVKADLKAFGGQAAIEADARGETQKKRVTKHLVGVIRGELETAAAAPGTVTRNAGEEVAQAANSQTPVPALY